MIGSFGKVAFRTSDTQVQNFIDLKRDSSSRFLSHETINTKPKSEFLGPGLETLSFSMELSAYLGVSPIGVINAFRAYTRTGQAENFILGGRNLGKYKVMSVSEGYGIITNRGQIISAKVDVTLEEYR